MRRKRLEVLGLVQGVGFRPHVTRLAGQLGLVGWVKNHVSGVTIEVQGAPEKVDAFLIALTSQLPPLATIDSASISDCPTVIENEFVIARSQTGDGAATPVPSDIALCQDCLAEFHDPQNRRYRYPFINCTNCGPRFSIIEGVPYDRQRTTMSIFPMCPACLREYQAVDDRRFHAQPTACPACGPEIWFADSFAIRGLPCELPVGAMPRGEAALQMFRRLIVGGNVAAVKGIGGFHIACDATNPVAVDRLRSHKRRSDKPLAVMMPNIEACRAVAHISAAEEELLTSAQRPIVLVRKREGHDEPAKNWRLAEGIAPHCPTIGLMLPYSPLHVLLLETGQPLVMTSGNIADEPIEWRNAEAVERLSPIVDGFLLHNRPIHAMCDDSVVRITKGEAQIVRRSRGYSPLPIRMACTAARPVLAVGGQLKEAFCIADRQHAYLSQHLGDLQSLAGLQALERNVAHFLKLFQLEPQVVVSDLHPNYLSTQWARDFAAERNIPYLQVQHHHAHLAALACEHGLPADQPLLGICFDGTGYGSDGNIWGGEVLLVEGAQFERLAHLAWMPLPGGDASIRRPYRAAMAYLRSAGIPWQAGLPCVDAGTVAEQKVLEQQLERNVNCPLTSSLGRLFDVVASLVGVRQQVSYEGQAACELEALATEFFLTTVGRDARAERYDAVPLEGGEYRFHFRGAPAGAIEFDSLLVAICGDLRYGVQPQVMAAKFHLAVAKLIGDLGRMFCPRSGLTRLGLSGGVFQNGLLVSLAVAELTRSGIEALHHRRVPTNDGGLALGQAWIAAQPASR